MNGKNEQPHAQHRSRLKKRFLKEGLDHFEDHNVLELLLFYAIPQADTNPIAHRLMKRYGTLDKVFDAPVEDLLQVEGIGAHTATLIKLIPALARRYCSSRFELPRHLPSYEEIGTFLVSQFLGKTNECVWGLFYSSTLELIDACELFSGSLHSVGFSVRDVAQKTLFKNASYLILAHNHPGGVPIASASDLDVTRNLRGFLEQMEVGLLDHFVIAENQYFSLSRERFDLARRRVEEQFGLK